MPDNDFGAPEADATVIKRNQKLYLPLTRICPDLVPGERSANVLSNVVFPAPLGPVKRDG